MSLSISAVIPAYNRARCLSRAIDSVINQSPAADEIIVVDDCSSDSTPQICAAFGDRIHYIRHPENKGASAARNTGVSAASSEWVAFLDSDDYWLANKTGKQLQFMEDNNLNVACTNYLLVDQDGTGKGQSLIKEEILEQRDFLWGCYVCPGSTMIARKALFEECGYFDESLKRLEDWDWFLRVTKTENVGNLLDVLSVINNTGYPQERDVMDGLALIHQRYIDSGTLSSQQKRCIRAGMEMELAKSAWIRKNYPKMLFYLLKSLCHVPFGNQAFNIVAARKLGKAY